MRIIVQAGDSWKNQRYIKRTNWITSLFWTVHSPRPNSTKKEIIITNRDFY